MISVLGISNLIGSLFYISTQSDCLSLSSEKNCFFQITDIKHFVSIFSLIFDPIDPFFIDFKNV